MDSAIEKMEKSVGMMISWSKMFTAFTKSKDAVSSIAYLPDFMIECSHNTFGITSIVLGPTLIY